MKSFIGRFNSGWKIACVAVSKFRWRQTGCVYALALFTSTALDSCFSHFYKTNSIARTDTSSVHQLLARGKYFILHANNANFALINPKMNSGNLEGEAYKLAPEHLLYLDPRKTFANRYAKKNEAFVLNEVHLYTRDSISYESHVSLPVKDFYKFDVYSLDEKTTRNSKVKSAIGLAGITAGVIGAVAIIAAVDNDFGETNPGGEGLSLGCSPMVYTVGENKTELAGILCSGAIFAPLQRTDYVPLPGIEPVNNTFNLQIRVGQNETLFLEDTKLLQVTHDKNDKVLLNQNGKVVVFRHPVPPEAAFIDEKQDVLKEVSGMDANYYSFTNRPRNSNTSDVILNFKKPAGVQSGKLVIRAKNSAWAAYLFRRFKSFYGDHYPNLVQQKDNAERKKLLQCELDQSLPLSVSLKVGDSWKLIDYFHTPGYQVARDMIMEIDLADFTSKDEIQIKLETTFMFWELDYAGMDFSGSLPFESTFIAASRISKSGVSPAVGLNPSNQYRHLSGDDHLNVDFIVKPAGNEKLTSSFFLMGNGYYHDNTRFAGKPQLSKLAAFSQKGAFDKFSRQTFEEWSSPKNNPANSLSIKNLFRNML
ncbi:MAG: hypothetical protein WKI04_04095 [Ferruginibacter sp.]